METDSTTPDHADRGPAHGAHKAVAAVVAVWRRAAGHRVIGRVA